MTLISTEPSKPTTDTVEAPSTLSVSELPDDALFLIFSRCDLATLGRLARVSKRINWLISQDCAWLAISKRLTLVVRNHCSRISKPSVTLRDHCRISLNWQKARTHTRRLVQYRVRQLPWLQLDEYGDLWVSEQNLVQCYPQGRRPTEGNEKVIQAHHSYDACTFVCKQQTLVTGSRYGSISCFETGSGRCLTNLGKCHNGDVQAVDMYPGSVIISASRDTTVKLWRHQTSGAVGRELRTLHMDDRVCSVTLSHNAGSFVTGTAGMNNVPPLRVWHTETAALLATLGTDYRNGAGVLSTWYNSEFELLSCGYDTYIRLWDLRLPSYKCVMDWEEPFDSTVYCVKSDGVNTIIAGTARNGLAILCDKRSPHPLQYYYAGRNRSPVYSLDFDSTNLHMAVDRGILTLDFGANTRPRRIYTKDYHARRTK